MDTSTQLALNATDGDFFSGETRVANGTLVQRAPGALAVAGGDVFMVDENPTGTVVTRATDAAQSAAVVQRGTGRASVSRVPAGVTSYTVSEGGTLRLTVPNKGISVAEKKIAATIPNASFEDNGGVGTAVVSYLVGKSSTTVVEKNGWYACLNEMEGTVTTDRAVFLYNKKHAIEQNNWLWPTDDLAPDGDHVLCIKGPCTAYTTMSVPQAGTYALTFKACTRPGYTYQRFYVHVGDERVGVVYPKGMNSFTHYRMEVEIPSAGDYRLTLASESLDKDGLTAFDDFRMTRIDDGDYPVPNGNFEALDAFDSTTVHTNGNVPKGWTLNQGPLLTISNVNTVVAATRMTKLDTSDSHSYGGPDDFFDQGHWALVFTRTGGVARTSFTSVRTGVFLLAVDVKAQAFRFKGGIDLRSVPSLQAKLSVNGTAYPLDPVSLTWGASHTVVYPKLISLREGDTVTLEFSQLTPWAICAIDNVRFTTDYSSIDFVRNGSFEEDSVWTRSNNKAEDLGGATGTSASRVGRSKYTDPTPQDYYVSEIGLGDYYVELCQMGSVSQNIEFSHPGLYELRFMASSRKTGKGCTREKYGRNPIRAWICGSDDVTNVIGRTGVENTNFVAHAFKFIVPSAGTYKLGIQGCNNHVNPLDGKVDRTSLLDGVGVTYVGEMMATNAPALPTNLSLNLNGGARLELDYPGTQEVFSVRFDGASIGSGYLNHTTHPDYIAGIGTLLVKPRGTVLLLR